MHDVDNNIQITVNHKLVKYIISAISSTFYRCKWCMHSILVNGSAVGIMLVILRLEMRLYRIPQLVVTVKLLRFMKKVWWIYHESTCRWSTSLVLQFRWHSSCEINKTHNGISSPADSYDITATSITTLGINSGGNNIIATQNIQYEILRPRSDNASYNKLLMQEWILPLVLRW